jgi:hypothetical protein
MNKPAPIVNRVVSALLLTLLMLTPAVARPSQIQVARQFLLAVLRADYDQAYQLLAPEVSGAAI